jgi:hypothetical protein
MAEGDGVGAAAGADLGVDVDKVALDGMDAECEGGDHHAVRSVCLPTNG